jgi:hypothetical protein
MSKPKPKQKRKEIKAWGTINCKGILAGVHLSEVEAMVGKQELDENWGEKGAKVIKVKITY